MNSCNASVVWINSSIWEGWLLSWFCIVCTPAAVQWSSSISGRWRVGCSKWGWICASSNCHCSNRWSNTWSPYWPWSICGWKKWFVPYFLHLWLCWGTMSERLLTCGKSKEVSWLRMIDWWGMWLILESWFKFLLLRPCREQWIYSLWSNGKWSRPQAWRSSAWGCGVRASSNSWLLRRTTDATLCHPFPWGWAWANWRNPSNPTKWQQGFWCR